MIVAYTGTPGSGKTLDAMHDVREYASTRGAAVVTNFPLGKLNRMAKPSQVFEIDNTQLMPDDLVAFAHAWPTREDGKLLVLDEAQLVFNSRAWSEGDRAGWVSFFSQHRKLGFKILLITQDLTMIDKQIRCLIEYEVKHRRVGNFGLVGKIIDTLTLHRLFASAGFWTGAPRVQIMTKLWVRTPGLSEMYDSRVVLDGLDNASGSCPWEPRQHR